jgi:hypothetical protein
MLLAAKAWQLREAARRSLNAGEFERAHELAIEAQKLQFTPCGESLRLLSAWLSSALVDLRLIARTLNGVQE